MSARLALGLGLAALGAGCLPPPRPTMYYGVVAAGARTQLVGAWTYDLRQTERAYCVTAYERLRTAGPGLVREHFEPGHPRSAPTFLKGDRETLQEAPFLGIIVTQIRPARYDSATSSSIRNVQCSPGEPVLHTHPPITCDSAGDCIAGGPTAFQCFPSRQDYETLKHSGLMFSVIQCERYVFVFYWRTQYP
jgi:hypothetical protein